jgi:hypothetical protein
VMRSTPPSGSSANTTPRAGEQQIADLLTSNWRSTASFSKPVRSQKLYGENPEAEKRYGPVECIGIRKTRIEGNPDPITFRLATRSGRTSVCGCAPAALLG